jgi:ribosomal peptide maturation radical SAM protein 1
VTEAATVAQRLALRTVLVSMPFQDARRPSIQLGLLKSIGTEAGFPVVTLHASLDFAALIGSELYAALCDHRGRLIGEWLFSTAAFGDAAPDRSAHLLTDFGADIEYLGQRDLARLREIRDHQVPTFLDALVDSDLWSHVRVVGFTSTFQQNTASFALARRLKARFPQLVTLFGGANFDDEMGREWVRALDCIDLAVIGEGDRAFPSLLNALATGRDPAGVPGVVRRGRGGVEDTPSHPSALSLDDLPFPDYAEYFARHRLIPTAEQHREVTIPFESGRGCWWGAKHHCTFCGLNGTSMAWRAKSPQRVLQELAHQASRHHVSTFSAVDNIMEPSYLTELLPALIKSHAGYNLFYEVKANLSRAQLQTLARSGVRHIQPGIESLSSHVLRLMRKGVRSSQNVNLLRWAQYYGIAASWNLLWGFPGETTEDYLAQAEVVPDLVHLRPPESVGRVWLERFSPMFTEPEHFPMRYRRPEPSYRYVYPAEVDLDRAAYFFEYVFEDALPDSAYEPLQDAVAGWSEAWTAASPPRLTYRATPGLLHIDDNRNPDQELTYAYEGQLARIYLAICERPTTALAVHRELGLDESVEWVVELFEAWRTEGLLFCDEDRVVALALPAEPP